jgi:hypothetical protein
MSKTFNYTKVTEVGEVCGSNEEFGEKFDYEVSDNQLLEALVDIIWADYFRLVNSDICFLKEVIKKFIINEDLLETLVDRNEEYLHDYFESEALQWYRS